MPKHPRLTESDLQEIARVYLSGRTIPEVAADLGLLRGTVYNVLKRLGVPRRSVGRPAGRLSHGKITLERRAELYEDLRSGRFRHMGLIADKYGLSRERVRKYAGMAGVVTYTNPVRKVITEKRTREARAARLAAKEARRTMLTRLWQSGASFPEMSRAIGPSPRSISGIIAHYRRQFPADFPPRRLRSDPAVARERRRAELAEKAARREYQRVSWLLIASLMRRGLSPAEMAGLLGIRRNAMENRISRYRKRNPEGFPPTRQSQASRP